MPILNWLPKWVILNLEEEKIKRNEKKIAKIGLAKTEKEQKLRKIKNWGRSLQKLNKNCLKIIEKKLLETSEWN